MSTPSIQHLKHEIFYVKIIINLKDNYSYIMNIEIRFQRYIVKVSRLYQKKLEGIFL